MIMCPLRSWLCGLLALSVPSDQEPTRLPFRICACPRPAQVGIAYFSCGSLAAIVSSAPSELHYCSIPPSVERQWARRSPPQLRLATSDKGRPLRPHPALGPSKGPELLTRIPRVHRQRCRQQRLTLGGPAVPR
ncbi:hypothetical protein NDU88_007513 [Pleurodeles waltl]|uniref:Secreted protein n=1 Tax=Pleurodeles waltl TaxID=8319 RepID=A0AAV7NAE7_PLEWA|nr:hypothetical protein NDU88_007513 [Pleurodeles waltl]